MARTAPTVDGTPAQYLLTYRFIDFTGDLISVSDRVLAADYSAAKAEAMAAALAALTNADLYEIRVAESYSAIADSSNAVNAVAVSVKDGLTVLAKDVLGNSRDFRVPALEAGHLVGDGVADEVDPSDAEVATALAAFLALHSDFSIVSARYTEQSALNHAVKI